MIANLQNGTWTLTYTPVGGTAKQVDADGNGSGGTVSAVQDTTGEVLAQDNYDAALGQLEPQDKQLELELKNLDTEHQAIQTEIDAVKKVLDKNIELTFKTFSG